MLKIFVNTWGNYNKNGADGGKWFELPMDEDELAEALEALAEEMGDHDPEWCIHDYEWLTPCEGEAISEYDNIEKLNELCEKLGELNAYEWEVYAAAVEVWGKKYVDIDSLDDYNLYTDIENEYDLGYYWAVESGCYDTSKMGTLANYIDYEAFGRDIHYETDGGFTSYGYIERV
jgi:antirestriction protein